MRLLAKRNFSEMMTVISEQWLEIETISQQMHDLALSCGMDSLPAGNVTEQAWQTIAALDKQRMRFLENYINMVDLNAIPESHETRLRTLLAFNQGLVDDCQVLQYKIASEISRIGQQRTAVNAYHKAQSI